MGSELEEIGLAADATGGLDLEESEGREPIEEPRALEPLMGDDDDHDLQDTEEEEPILLERDVDLED